MRGPPGREVLTVSEVTGRISSCLEKNFGEVWVQGEVSEFVSHSSGHWYFTLKDDKSTVRAVMFKFQNIYLRLKPEDGMEVLCRGRITTYAQRSIYQINVEWMEPVGVGALYARFEKLKARLLREGIFDEGKKKPIPSPLKRIAIITSATGAALQDMLRVLREHDPGIEVLIVPALVQGKGAAEELAHALAGANRPEVANPPGRLPLEAIIIGRGGGSLEDLWAFNEEVLARAIYASVVPVISAVGHEVDYTIADFAADLRAPTPTAAAQIVAAGRTERTQKLAHDFHRIHAAMTRRLDDAGAGLSAACARLSDPRRDLMEQMIRTDELMDRGKRAVAGRLDLLHQRVITFEQVLRAQDPRSRHRLHQTRLEGLSSRLMAAGTAGIEGLAHRLETSAAQLYSLSPRATLSRGYAIARQEGRVVREAGAVSAGDGLEVIVWRGRIDCEVKKVDTEDKT